MTTGVEAGRRLRAAIYVPYAKHLSTGGVEEAYAYSRNRGYRLDAVLRHMHLVEAALAAGHIDVVIYAPRSTYRGTTYLGRYAGERLLWPAEDKARLVAGVTQRWVGTTGAATTRELNPGARVEQTQDIQAIDRSELCTVAILDRRRTGPRDDDGFAERFLAALHVPKRRDT